MGELRANTIEAIDEIKCGGLIQSRNLDVTQTAHGFTLPMAGVRPIVYNNGTSQYDLARSDAEATAADQCIVKINDLNSFRVQNRGYITVTGHGLTVGKYYVLSDTTAGNIVAEDSFTGDNTQRILFVMDANRLMLLVDPMIVP